ncbi:LPS translocon maturation chaperone LptM [Permianibacter aggregans]|uniref:Putative lipoprotein n=1 Tax=Permianibacter aggregans TaxID=1510150 RepID=A0A4R6USA1_9GAMM|nr:lipoprotein [Permianibacter aggregans]QGX39969.1 hypothetical protein E2H98_09965 [Permianibacter aggregans]TDQ46224.1 putative lipoprotein [Permianibacter aggregans]
MLRIALALLLLATLAGCGQKGDLVKPTPEPAPKSDAA